MPPTSDEPGGAGEFGGRAVDGGHGVRLRARHRDACPTSFPINHNRADLGFTPAPTVPPCPRRPPTA